MKEQDDVVPHPDFASNRLLYVSYSKPVGDSGSTTAVSGTRLDEITWADLPPMVTSTGFNGCAIGADGAGAPTPTVGDTPPNPEHKMTTVSPAETGVAGSARV